MITDWVRNHRARIFRTLVAEYEEFYQRSWSADAIRIWQLKSFNDQWHEIRLNVPYFTRLCIDKKLPDSFASWDEFLELMPVMNRKTLQLYKHDLVDPSKPVNYYRTTGGSTSEPIQLASWNSEMRYAGIDSWYGRSHYGIDPTDKLFMIWGHSHLLGHGMSGWVNGKKREFKDLVAGYLRWSAYQLGDAHLRQAADQFLHFRPRYVIAYSGALDRFVHVNRDLRTEFHNLHLKAAIATAEGFPREDSAELISDILGCPVTMEYGAVETGPMAIRDPQGTFSIYWRHYFFSGAESKTVLGGYEIEVTNLYPRCTPLVRYQVGDLVQANPDTFQQSFTQVIGRCNDFILLNGNDPIHSEVFTHAIKESPSITDFEVIQSKDGNIKLTYIAQGERSAGELDVVRRRLVRIDPRLAGVKFEQVDSLEHTISGKTRRIRREIEPQEN